MPSVMHAHDQVQSPGAGIGHIDIEGVITAPVWIGLAQSDPCHPADAGHCMEHVLARRITLTVRSLAAHVFGQKIRAER